MFRNLEVVTGARLRCQCLFHAVALLMVLLWAYPTLGEQTPVRSRSAMLIQTAATPVASIGKAIHLEFPADAQRSTLKVILNGQDVTKRFASSVCGQFFCEDAVLLTTDGLRAEKNALYATVKTADGRVVSSRQRFEGSTSAPLLASRPATRSQGFGIQDISSSNPQLPTLSAFLPPSVAFTTNPSQSGYKDGSPWITVGSQQNYPDASLQCSGQAYSVVVLNHQTLQEITSAPESSPQCFANDTLLSTYLTQNLAKGDLVIVATNYGVGTPNTYSLDTTPIGGTNYTSVHKDNPGAYPSNYLAIGVAGANAGQAYENYLTYGTPDAANPPFAKGTLVEDINGNYNFVSSDAIEYIVSPNNATPLYGNFGMIQLGIPAKYQTSSKTTNVYLPPYGQDMLGTGGYWLLVVSRITLQVVPSPSNPNAQCTTTTAIPGVPANTDVYANCGTFYQTNNLNSQNPASLATSEFLRLASDLNAVAPNQLAILMTIANAAYAGNSPSDFTVAGINDGNGNYAYWGPQGGNGGAGFFSALKTLGLPPYATMQMWHDAAPNQLSAYSGVASRPLSNVLTGSSVVSTTAYAQQGQTGYLHGAMTRDRLGLYRPSQSAQEESFSTDNSDFSMTILSAQQPAEWPELSTLLTTYPGGSVAGQQDAYRYISNYLITKIYLRSTTGHQDDLHYFFTGSLNSFIDYHLFDPATLTFPTSCQNNGNGTVTCALSDASLGTATFTQADFNNVKLQMSQEVVSLTSVTAFLSTGSVNMKDIIAAGNANVALALIQASATIQAAQDVNPPNSTRVGLKTSNILGMVSSVVTVATTIGTDGIIGPEFGGVVDKGIGILGSFLSGAGSVAGGLTLGADPTGIPNPDYTLQTTIGELASSDLQGSMSAGFDATADVILSDPVKLSKLAALVTDTNNPSYYAPQQTVQNAAIAVINRGTQRSIFLSVAEALYQIHFWPQVVGDELASNPNPEYGRYYPGAGGQYNGNSCQAFYYFQENQIVAYSYAAFPSPSPNGSPFEQYGGPIDGYVFASGPVHNAGKSNAYAGNPTQAVTFLAFGKQSGQLNLPEEPFVLQGGPMNLAGQWVDMSSGSNVDTGATNPTGFFNEDICDAVPGDWVGSPAETTPAPSSRVVTSTTLTMPSSVAAGESVTLSGKVTAADGSVPSGTLAFFQGPTQIGEFNLDATGSATTTIAKGFSAGNYTVQAFYTNNAKYFASESAELPLTVYSNSPDIALSLSTRTLPVTYGSPSAPVTVQVNSKYGLAGSVEFSCSGLPAGMLCSFTPAQTPISANGSAATTFTITSSLVVSSRQQTANLMTAAGVLFLPGFLGLSALGGKSGRRVLRRSLCLLPVLLLILLGGCSSGSHDSGGGGHVTGPQTILVNATVGNTTRSITLLLNVQ